MKVSETCCACERALGTLIASRQHCMLGSELVDYLIASRTLPALLNGNTQLLARPGDCPVASSFRAPAVDSRSANFEPPATCCERRIDRCGCRQVLDAPPGARVLATSRQCPVEMFALGHNVFGIQGEAQQSPHQTAHFVPKVWKANRAMTIFLGGMGIRRTLSPSCAESRAPGVYAGHSGRHRQVSGAQLRAPGVPDHNSNPNPP